MTDEKLAYFIDKYADTILRLSYSYLKNMYDAQDVSQTVFIKLYQQEKIFNDEEHEKAYILHITANVCKNILKSAWRKRTVDIQTVGEIEAPTICDDNLLEFVNELDYKYRTVIYLHYYEGYKTEEIATILKVKPATIRTRLARAREQLKQHLGDDFNG